jgi:hypothetical protein
MSGAAECRIVESLPPELARNRSAMSVEAANREIYRLRKNGILVCTPSREHRGREGEQRIKRLENLLGLTNTGQTASLGVPVLVGISLIASIGCRQTCDHLGPVDQVLRPHRPAER